MVHKSYSTGFGSVPNATPKKITESTSPNYDGPEDADNDFICGLQLERIANSLEEILRLVKQDMKRMQKLND